MYKLPPLGYSFDALEPYIDTKTMELHYTKHHQTYVDELNKALEKYPQFQNIPLNILLETLDQLPEDIRTKVRNNGGGHYNHSMFWLIMSKNGGGQPIGRMKTEIEKYWGNFENFKEQFSAAAKTRFGSGWAWLSINQSEDLVITSTPNQDSPLFEGLQPIMGLDVWEHAYYLKYNNRRVNYIEAWWNVVDWHAIEENLKNLD